MIHESHDDIKSHQVASSHMLDTWFSRWGSKKVPNAPKLGRSRDVAGKDARSWDEVWDSEAVYIRGSNAKLTQLGATANMSKNCISSPKKYHMHMILNSFQRRIQNKILGTSMYNTRHVFQSFMGIDFPFYIPTISP